MNRKIALIIPCVVFLIILGCSMSESVGVFENCDSCNYDLTIIKWLCAALLLWSLVFTIRTISTHAMKRSEKMLWLLLATVPIIFLVLLLW